jgi:ABC-type lipoprotein export system ATPase subunit
MTTISSSFPGTSSQRNSNRLKAWLSQSMNFVADLAAGEFIAMHAESRMVNDPQAMALEALNCANELAEKSAGASDKEGEDCFDVNS